MRDPDESLNQNSPQKGSFLVKALLRLTGRALKQGLEARAVRSRIEVLGIGV